MRELRSISYRDTLPEPLPTEETWAPWCMYRRGVWGRQTRILFLFNYQPEEVEEADEWQQQ